MNILEIKKFMKDNRITYEYLSNASGIPIGTLKSIFSGRTPNPLLDTIEAIKKALNLDDQEPIIDNPLLSELNKRGISLDDLRNLSPADIEFLARMAESLVAKK